MNSSSNKKKTYITQEIGSMPQSNGIMHVTPFPLEVENHSRWRVKALKALGLGHGDKTTFPPPPCPSPPWTTVPPHPGGNRCQVTPPPPRGG